MPSQAQPLRAAALTETKQGNDDDLARQRLSERFGYLSVE